MTQKWTQLDVDRLQKGRGKASAPPGTTIGKPSKYRNVKCVVAGERFDSRHEADVWLMLKAREAAKDIVQLERQVRYSLYCPTAGPDCEVAVYVADFQWRDRNGLLHVGDAKGQRKRICPYPLKAKWLKLQDGITIEEF